MRLATSPAGGPVLVCADCCGGFVWDSSPDLARCVWCAELHVWREGEGAADHIEHASRLSAGRTAKGV